MAIRIRQPIKINPIDTTDKVAIGLKLPFGKKGPLKLDFTTKDHAKSKLINLLLTEPGERINQPTFGVGLKQKLFEISDDNLEDNIRSVIKSQVALYVPEVTIENIKFKPEADILYLNVTYKVIANSQSDSIALAFNNTNESYL